MLFRGGVAAGTEQNWYLRSEIKSAGESRPIYRPGVALYGAVPSLASRAGGAANRHLPRPPGQRGAVRRSPGGLGAHLGRPSLGGQRQHGGKPFSGNTYGMQVGQDLYARTSDSGHQDRYGVFLVTRAPMATCAGTRWASAATAPASSAFSPTAWRLLTHVGPGGWYTDTVILGSRLKVNPTSNAGDTRATGPRLHRVGRSGTADRAQAQSEPEPQAQLIYQHTRIDSVRDAASDVSFAPKNALIGRVRAAAGRVPGSTRHLEALFAGRPGAHAGDATRSASAATRPPRRARVAPRPGWAWALPWTPANASAFPRPPATASTWAASGARRCRAIWGANPLVNGASPDSSPDEATSPAATSIRYAWKIMKIIFCDYLRRFLFI